VIWLAVWAFVVALLSCALLLRRARQRGPLRRPCYGDDKPQRFHTGEVPRLGGIALFAAVVVAWSLGVWRSLYAGDTAQLAMQPWIAWSLLAMLPAVAAGVLEDVLQRLSVRWRLALTFVSAALLVWLCGLTVPRLGWPALEQWLGAALPWLGLALALLALGGLPHAFNIIDGYNGLAGVVALIICLAMAHVALQVGDRTLAAMLVGVAAATAGFLVWNYPAGLLFAGDGGAYVWGLTIALCALVLVQRHAEVSPWFPVLLLIYPVWETLFSIYRKLARGKSPGEADALHLHQMIYRRVVRSVFDADLAEDLEQRMLKRNNGTAPYLWAFTALTVVPALLFWRNTPALIGFCLLFVMGYIAVYRALARFKRLPWPGKKPPQQK